ncbi:hypothetical protein SH584_04240 [Sphingomonas sp. LY29]|uniref:hypothetical protein n=1 Tax=Sphingomonas sp. LY29 TaxID=3095341 RepID=UPI002D780FDC|nr:hypothetical protein [Sphingomonas sp. LY29]WRP26650.1 hypothetical protein SH584_04240 [Sphingomonas sp. LY29]
MRDGLPGRDTSAAEMLEVRRERSQDHAAVAAGAALNDVAISVHARNVNGMERVTNVIERAYQIAPSCNDLAEVKKQLKREGYLMVDENFDSKSLRNSIVQLIETAP